MADIEYSNEQPLKVAIDKESKMFSNEHPYKVVIVGGNAGGEGKVVEELPEEGETGYIYLVLKESTSQGDIYDEYMWALQPDGETYGWEHIGATNEVKIELYDSTGQNTDGAMTQKAVTDAISNFTDKTYVDGLVGQPKLLTKSNYGSGVQYIKAWELPVGLYRVNNNGKTPSQSAFVHWRPYNSDTTTEISCNVFLVADHPQNSSSKTIVAFYTGGGDSDGWFKTTVFQTASLYGNLDNVYRMLSTQEIVDNLTSTETKKTLSANQGKVLNDKINGLGTVEYVTFTSVDPATMTATPSKTPAEVKAMIDAGKTVYYKLVIPQRLPSAVAGGTYLFAPQFIGDLSGSDWNAVVATLVSAGSDSALFGAYIQYSDSPTGQITISQLPTTAYVNNAIESVTGDLRNLNTTVKTSLVAAINEVVGDIGDIDTALTTITTGTGV